MAAKILLCDLGNTSLKFGLGNQTELLQTFTLPAGHPETCDSLGLKLLAATNYAGTSANEIKCCVISSVNPALDNPLKEAALKYFNCPALFAGKDLPVPLQNNYPRPQEVGADIIVGAYEARQLCPDAASLIVADFGTAATFAVVEGDSFNGGLIFPGPATAMKALALNTASLPQVALEYPGEEPQPCLNTVTSIQHGLLFGYGAMTDGLCSRLKKKMKQPVLTVATGGFAALVNKISNVFDKIVPTLILDGLLRMYLNGHEN